MDLVLLKRMTRKARMFVVRPRKRSRERRMMLILLLLRLCVRLIGPPDEFWELVFFLMNWFIRRPFESLIPSSKTRTVSGGVAPATVLGRKWSALVTL